MKAYLGYRVWDLVPSLIVATSEEDVLQSRLKEDAQKMQALMQCRLVTPDGRDAGMTLGDFLQGYVGVNGIRQASMQTDVRESDLVVPTGPRLITPN